MANFILKRFSKKRYYIKRKVFNFVARRIRFRALRGKLALGRQIFKSWKKRKLRSRQNVSFMKYFAISTCLGYKQNNHSQYIENLALIQRVLPSARLIPLFLRYFFFTSSFGAYKKFYSIFKNQVKINYAFLSKFVQSGKDVKKKNFYFFIDGNKSPLMIMRAARDVHISFTKKKTTRNVRYKFFLKKYLKKLKEYGTTTISTSFLTRLYRFAFSWYQSFLLVTYGLIWVNGEQKFGNIYLNSGDIFQISVFKGLSLYLNFFKKKLIRIRKRIKRAAYLYFKSKKRRWITRKKNSTRFLNWTRSATLGFPLGLIFDFYSLTGALMFKHGAIYNSEKPSFLDSTTLKLASWKFRAR